MPQAGPLRPPARSPGTRKALCPCPAPELFPAWFPGRSPGWAEGLGHAAGSHLSPEARRAPRGSLGQPVSPAASGLSATARQMSRPAGRRAEVTQAVPCSWDGPLSPGTAESFEGFTPWFGASLKYHGIVQPCLKETSAFLLENIYKQKIVIFKIARNRETSQF